ncbi:MAG: hypothetical protein ACJAT2_001443 [Bacteriovoracaceae bacterium]|jgi:hypothetical protein
MGVINDLHFANISNSFYNIRVIKLILIIFILSSPVFIKQASAAGTRGEIQRYTLLHDRYIVDRGLRKLRYDQFLDFDIVASSGLKSFLGEVESSSKNAATTAERDLAVLGALAKNVNTERFVDIDVTLGAPLPYIRYRKFQLLPNLFYNINMGASTTLSNLEDGTTIKSQSYLKLEKRMGILNRIKWNKEEEVRLAIYSFTKSDVALDLNVSGVAGKSSVFKFDDAIRDQKMITSDWGYTLTKPNYTLLAEIQELQLLSQSKGVKSLQGTRPFLHSRITNNLRIGNLLLKPFYGFHFRRWYNLMEGLYVGASLKYNIEIPFEFLMKLSDEFITLMPQFKTKYFQFIYSIKTPYRNPRDKIWVSALHNVNISIPIP